MYCYIQPYVYHCIIFVPITCKLVIRAMIISPVFLKQGTITNALALCRHFYFYDTLYTIYLSRNNYLHVVYCTKLIYFVNNYGHALATQPCLAKYPPWPLDPTKEQCAHKHSKPLSDQPRHWSTYLPRRHSEKMPFVQHHGLKRQK